MRRTNGLTASVFYAPYRSNISLNLRDDKMCGNRSRAACNRSDGKRCRISGRVANRQNRVDRGSLYDCHPNDLRCSCRTTYYSIFQIFTVQSQDQLTCFCYTNLEQHLIRANLCRCSDRPAGNSHPYQAQPWRHYRAASVHKNPRN